LGMVAAICIFMVVHTILELRKLNRETVFIDIIKDGEKVGVITLDKTKLDWIIDTDPIRFTSEEMIEVCIKKRNDFILRGKALDKMMDGKEVHGWK